MELGEAERALGDQRAQPLYERADAPTDRPQVLAPVGRAPHLEPVDDELVAPGTAAARAAASSEKYGKRAVCTTS